MHTDNWSRRTIDFLAPYFEAAAHSVRISTGYFTIQAYNLIRGYLTAKQVAILIGYDEAAQEQLRTRLVAAVMQHLSQWSTENRRAAVTDLVGKLERGEIQFVEQSPADTVEARMRRRDHAKLYLFDDNRVVVGSANLTISGLHLNTEAVTAVDDPDRIAYWQHQYESYWNAPDTEDITQALLEALRRWLELHSPYDVYLKTLLALVTSKEVPPPRAAYKMPVKYQQVVVERVLRQLDTHHGSMLVASTGLGKTVMATHAAYRLHLEGRIKNVLLFAPLQVLPDWEQELDAAGVAYKLFTRDLLDQPKGKVSAEANISRMLAALDQVDDKYMVIVDETQRFRHRLRAGDGETRYSFQRLRSVVKDRDALILLLTATPYSKGVEDINNQLYLLPHLAEPQYRTPRGQYTIPGTVDDLIPPRAWRVSDTARFFEMFIDLPVTTVISTSQVARDFATHDPQGDYVQFGEEKRWIPQVDIHRVDVPVFEEEAMRSALNRRYFEHKLIRYKSRDRGGSTRLNVQREAEIAWNSSPAALAEVLRKTIEGEYQVKLTRKPEERQHVLGPILERVQSMSCEDDLKFQTLRSFVRQLQANGQKVLVFTERHATAVYLEESLSRAAPKLRVATTSKRTSADKYELKDFRKEVLDLIYAFAPEANADKLPKGLKPKPIDVLIVTDAFSAGINLQDASVVIHYDLAWTPDILLQRAGRILRFWKEPRVIEFYVFVGKFEPNTEGYRQTLVVERRLEVLTERSQQAQRFSALPVFPDASSVHFGSLARLSEVTTQRLGLADIGELVEFDAISPLLRHNTELQRNLELASSIPDDITSAKVYRGKSPLLYLLLRYEDRYHWCVYDLAKDDVVDTTEDRLLDLIHCKPETPVADVPADEVEAQAQRCRLLWIKRERIVDPDQVQRICALYLQPQHLSGNLLGLSGD